MELFHLNFLHGARPFESDLSRWNCVIVGIECYPENASDAGEDGDAALVLLRMQQQTSWMLQLLQLLEFGCNTCNNCNHHFIPDLDPSQVKHFQVFCKNFKIRGLHLLQVLHVLQLKCNTMIRQTEFGIPKILSSP